MTYREDQERSFKAFYDQLCESVAEVNWARHFLEEDVLVDPVVDEEEHDHHGVGEGDDGRVE